MPPILFRGSLNRRLSPFNISRGGIGAGGRIVRVQPTSGADILLNGITCYWTLGEASGTRVDSTASAQDLTDNNTVGNAAGKVSPLAAQFVPANSEYLSHVDSAILDAGDIDWTFAGWFYPDTVVGDQYIISKGAGFVDYELFVSTSSLNFRHWNGSYTQVFTLSGTIVAGQWHRFVAWHDTTLNTMNLQLNNDAVRTVADVTAPTTTADGFAIGYRVATGGNFFGGRIAEVGYWKRIFTDAERNLHWNGGVGVTYPFPG